MTPEAALVELLARVGANRGAAVLISEDELGRWPAAAVKAMKAEKLLQRAGPASSVVCPGCEQECVMPVQSLPSASQKKPKPFVVCHKRNDINRVAVLVSRLEQWQASAETLADLMADLLGVQRPEAGINSASRCEVGTLKGTKHSSHVVLLAEGQLAVSLAGYSVDVADILSLTPKGLKLDKARLIRCVDKPIAGAGDQESAAHRRERLKKRVQAEKNKGNKAFLKTVAGGEGISVSRLKQIVGNKPKPTESRTRRNAYSRDYLD